MANYVLNVLNINNEFFKNINFIFFDFYYNCIWEDMLTVFFLYNFIKYIIICSINELIWPTHFFNKKHSNSSNSIRFRSYVEYFEKFFNNNILLKRNFFLLLQYQFLKTWWIEESIWPYDIINVDVNSTIPYWRPPVQEFEWKYKLDKVVLWYRWYPIG